MSDDSLPLENAHEHNVFPFAMAEIASRRAVAGLARRRASAAGLNGHGRVQSVDMLYAHSHNALTRSGLDSRIDTSHGAFHRPVAIRCNVLDATVASEPCC